MLCWLTAARLHAAKVWGTFSHPHTLTPPCKQGWGAGRHSIDPPAPRRAPKTHGPGHVGLHQRHMRSACATLVNDNENLQTNYTYIFLKLTAWQRHCLRHAVNVETFLITRKAPKTCSHPRAAKFSLLQHTLRNACNLSLADVLHIHYGTIADTTMLFAEHCLATC